MSHALGPVAEPVPVPNRNRDRFLGFLIEPNRTDIIGSVKRSTQTEPKCWFRPYDQLEPVGSDHPINPNPPGPTSRSTRTRRSRPIGTTVHNPTPSVSPHVSNRFLVHFLSDPLTLPKPTPCRLPGAHVKNKRHTLHNHPYNNLYNHLHNVSI